MKTYLFQKTVAAARITGVTNQKTVANPMGRYIHLALDDGTQVHVDSEQYWFAAPGCYFVRDGAGKDSVVTPAEFERWYAPVVDTGTQVHPDSALPHRRRADYFDSMDQAQMQSLGIERERRERREAFDRMERQQIEQNRKIG